MIENLRPPVCLPNNRRELWGAVLWTICQLLGKNLPQKEINHIGGDPEVVKVLDSLKTKYNN